MRFFVIFQYFGAIFLHRDIKVLKYLELLYDVFLDVESDKKTSKMFYACPGTPKSIFSTFGTP